MDPTYEIFKQLGAGGGILYLLWVGVNKFLAHSKESTERLISAAKENADKFINSYAEQVKATHAEMSKRIDASEEQHRVCQEDRQRLQEQLVELLKK